jgi:uncharacterized membrane protein
MENQSASAPDQQDIAKGKTNAIIAYITPIGWLIAYLMHGNAKTKFAAFHLRQALGLAIVEGVLMALSVMFIFLFFSFPILFWGLRFVNIGILGLAVMGIINAGNGKSIQLPLVGDFLDKTFSGIN